MKNKIDESVKAFKDELMNSIDSTPWRMAVYYKMGPGEYAEFEQFIGITTPTLRKIAKHATHLSLDQIAVFLHSSFNEERLFALIILVLQYGKASPIQQNKIYQFYIKNLKHINNWNLVDNSAYQIVGQHLWHKNRRKLYILAKSNNLWERRVAIVATFFMIKQGEFFDTLKIVTGLFEDPHDLIHKASGWMLREIGKRDETELLNFLDQHVLRMPRTMLRYAIERLPEQTRQYYLRQK